MYKDVRIYFDHIIVDSSRLDELVEVLQYTYIYGTRCLGQVVKVIKARKGEQAIDHGA